MSSSLEHWIGVADIAILLAAAGGTVHPLAVVAVPQMALVGQNASLQVYWPSFVDCEFDLPQWEGSQSGLKHVGSELVERF